MSASVVSLIFTALVAVIMLSSVLFGIIRGFKKTAFRGIFLLATSLILLLISGLFAGLLINVDISFLGIAINGQTPKTAEQAIALFLNQKFGEGMAENNAELVKTLLSFVKLFLTTFMFWILFVVLKYSLLPLNNYLYRLIFRSNDEKKYDKFKKQLKKSHGEVLAFANNFDGGSSITPIDPNEKNQGNADGNNVVAESAEQGEFNITPINVSSGDLPANEQNSEAPKANAENEEYVPQNEYSPVQENQDKQPEEANEEIESVKKPKKRRLFGALLGIVVGLFSSAMFLMPVNGLLKLGNEIDQYEAVAMNSEEGYITHLSNGVFSKISKGYSASFGNKVLTYSGAMAVSNFTFNTLSSKKINDVSVNLSKDAVKIIDVVNKAYELKNVDLNNHERANLDTAIDKVGNVVQLALDIKMFESALGVVVPFVVDYAVENNIIKANENVQPIVNLALNNLKEVKNKDFINEINGVLNIIKQTNLKLEGSEESILSTLLKGGNIDYVGMVSQIPNENVNSLVDSLFSYKDYTMQSTSSIIPELVVGGFNMVEPTINSTLNNAEHQFVYTDTAETINSLIQTKEEQSESLKKILKGVINIAKNYKTSVGDAVISCGPVLQQLKGNKIMSSQSYSSLIDAVQEFANRSAKDLLSTAGVKDETLNSITSGLSNVEDWEKECECLGNAYKIYSSNNSDESKVLPMENGKISLSKTKFAVIGRVLDEAKGSELLSDDKIKAVICDLIDSNVRDLGDFDKYLKLDNEGNENIKTQLKLNIMNIGSFEDELTLVGNAVSGETPLINFNDLKTTSGVNEKLSSIGKGLDELTKGTIVTNEIAVQLVKNISQDYKSENTTNTQQAINNFIDTINTNLPSAIEGTSFSWEIELGNISKLSNISENINNLKSIGKSLDDASENSDLITDKTIASMLVTIIEGGDYYVKDSSGNNNETSGKGGAINEFFDSIVNKLGSVDNESTISWEREFEILDGLKESSACLSAEGNVENVEVNNFSALDNASFNYKVENGSNIDDDDKNSKIITKISIINLVSNLIDNSGYASPVENSVEEKINLFLSGNVFEFVDGSKIKLDFEEIKGQDFNFASNVFKWENEISYIKNCVESINKIVKNLSSFEVEIEKIRNYSSSSHIIKFEESQTS